jgi:copper(I)-binding protein
MNFRAVLAVLGLTLSALPAAARVGSDITVNNGVVWTTFHKGANTEGFLQIHNTGATDDVLASVDCTIGAQTQIVDANGNVLPSVTIPAGQTITFSPTGTHIVILSMRYLVEDGSIVPCAMSFRDNGDVGAYLNASAKPSGN